MSMVTLIRDDDEWIDYRRGLSQDIRHHRNFPANYPCLVVSVLAPGQYWTHVFTYPDDAALLLEAYEASR